MSHPISGSCSNFSEVIHSDFPIFFSPISSFPPPSPPWKAIHENQQQVLMMDRMPIRDAAVALLDGWIEIWNTAKAQIVAEKLEQSVSFARC